MVKGNKKNRTTVPFFSFFSCIGFLIIVFIMSFVLSAVGYAAVFCVTNPTEFQDALSTAKSNGQNDTINVSAGVYSITTTLTYDASTDYPVENYALNIIGVGPRCIGAGVPILDGGGSVQVLYILTSYTSDTNAHISISDITFQNGGKSGSMGGGLAISTRYADITVEDSQFINNTANYGGGTYAFSAVGAAITFKDNTFSGNTAASGGGAYASGGTVTFTNNTFSSNTATAPATFNTGGGVEASGETVTFTNNTFSNNTANDWGGGVDVSSDTGTVALTNNTFTGNTAVDHSGGVFASSDSGTITLTNTTFNGNATTAFTSTGGGVYALSESGIITLTSNTFSDNAAFQSGGGAAGSSFSGTVNFTDNVFTNNTTTNGSSTGGGAYAFTDKGVITLTKNKFASNTAGSGGGGAVFSYSSGTVLLSIMYLMEIKGLLAWEAALMPLLAVPES